MRAPIITLVCLSLFFSSLAQQPKLMLPTGHNYFLNDAMISGDGNRTLTMSEFDGAILWDNKSRLIIKKFPIRSEEERFKKVSLSYNGDYVLVCTNQEWRLSWFGQENHMQFGLGEIQNAKLGNTSNVVATMTKDQVIIRELKTKQKKAEIKTGLEQTDLQFSRDDKTIVTWSAETSAGIHVWDTESGKMKLKFASPSGVSRLLINNDMSRIIVKGRDQAVYIFNALTGAIITTIPFASIDDNPFSGNTSKLLIRTKDKLSWWSTVDGKQINEIGFQYLSEYSKAFFYGKEQDKLCTINSAFITIWNTNTLQQEAEVINPGDDFAQTISVHSSKSLAAITYNNSPETILLELNSLSKPVTLKGAAGAVLDVSFTGKENQLLVSTMLNTSAWDYKIGKQTVSMENAANLYTYSVTRDKNYLVGISGQQDQRVRLWSLGTGKALGIFQGDLSSGIHRKTIDGLVFNKKGTELIAGDEEGYIHSWSYPNGRKILTKKMHGSFINALDFNPSDSLLATGGHQSELKIWDANNLRLIKDIRLMPDVTVDKLQFSPDGNWLVASFFPRNFLLVINPQKDYSMNYIEFSGAILDFKFALHDNSVLVATDKVVYSLDRYYNKQIVFEADSNKRISSALWSGDGKKIIIVYSNDAAELRTTSGELIYTFYNFNSADYYTMIPSGYYQCSPGAAKLLHYVTNDFKIITFQQLDIRYNRPDKVQDVIGSTDTALIRGYRKAWEKRIKKLGIDTTAFRDGYSVPECDFVNRDEIEYEQTGNTLKLHIKGKDSIYKLDRFNVWVNESPVFGQKGMSIKSKKRNSIDTKISIVLSQGENRIECSITNVNGTESYRMPLYVKHNPPVKQKEAVYFIGIGIDQFRENSYNLQYSCKDIRDLALKLKERYKDSITIDTLFNQNVTTEKIKALKEKLMHTSVNDKVIISYSGHGLLSKDYDYYLSTYAVNFDRPEKNGLPYDELENLLDSIPARKKLMLIDACHSGEVDKDDLVTLNASSDSLIKGLKPVAYKKEGPLGLKNSFELMQSLFVNVGKSTGATIISAAAGTQFALERNDLKNGVFTYSILEAMNKYPNLTISELKKIVGERVEEITKGLQKPTSRNENIAVDWELW